MLSYAMKLRCVKAGIGQICARNVSLDSVLYIQEGEYIDGNVRTTLGERE
jgi:hypothetical protein